MKYLMLMWVENDASGGTQEDINAWAAFESDARKAGVLVVGGALQPAATTSKLVLPELARPEKGMEVSNGTFSHAKAQIEAFYVLDCKKEDEAISWARKLPTWGTVEVRPLIDYDLS